jgi:hypothetical protein
MEENVTPMEETSAMVLRKHPGVSRMYHRDMSDPALDPATMQ